MYGWLDGNAKDCHARDPCSNPRVHKSFNINIFTIYFIKLKIDFYYYFKQ